ncbi:TlpA family protein disulfide reductase [Sphingomonas oryzagri]
MRSLIACLPLIVALGIAGCDKPKAANEQASAGNNAAPPAFPTAQQADEVDRSHKGEAMPAMPFAQPGGAPATLTRFRGHPVLVNLWATWCAPCVKELPALDQLAANSTGRMAVIAVSQDMNGDADVQPFWASHGIKALTAYTDKANKLMTAMGAAELPVTVLYDSKGKEVWRVAGGKDWNGPEMAKLLAEAK